MSFTLYSLPTLRLKIVLTLNAHASSTMIIQMIRVAVSPSDVSVLLALTGDVIILISKLQEPRALAIDTSVGVAKTRNSHSVVTLVKSNDSSIGIGSEPKRDSVGMPATKYSTSRNSVGTLATENVVQIATTRNLVDTLHSENLVEAPTTSNSAGTVSSDYPMQLQTELTALEAEAKTKVDIKVGNGKESFRSRVAVRFLAAER